MNWKKSIAIVLFTFGVTGFGVAQDKPKSTAETVTGTINGATITIKYGSPSVREREVWGKLVPFDKVWRAGANDATTFTTDKEITVEGKKLPAGTYTFFVIPNKSESTVIFNKVEKQWGAYEYSEEKDQLRVKVKPQVAEKSIEKLTYIINKDNVTLSWEKWNLPIKVK